MIWGFFDFWENRVFRGFACSVVEEIGVFFRFGFFDSVMKLWGVFV